MDTKKIILLGSAAIIAIGSGLMAKSMFGQATAPVAVAAAAPTGPEVLVAVKDVPVGTIVTPDIFQYAPWPKTAMEANYFAKGGADPTSLNGTVVRNAITAGQPVTLGALVKPGERGFLAAALSPGMRAVTIAVSASTAVAGFVFPGDRVDLLLSQTIEGNGEQRSLKTAETVVRNLRVLAVDQRTVAEGSDGKPVIQTAQNVTVETTPRIAEKIAVAQTLGQVSLALRSLADSAADLDTAIATGAVNVTKDNGRDTSLLAALAARPSDSATTYQTGGDVSRFQRRTVPMAAPAAPAAAPAAASVATVTVPMAPRPAGPVVRVTRGGEVTTVSVGGK